MANPALLAGRVIDTPKLLSPGVLFVYGYGCPGMDWLMTGSYCNKNDFTGKDKQKILSILSQKIVLVQLLISNG